MQTVPYQYALLPLPDGTVVYTTSFIGTYAYHFNCEQPDPFMLSIL